ncbi:MAG: tyrosine-protein kinase family protein [Desulfobacteraceae bacterium]|nr:tyrosine-protein kinase family protein [Desulfobacteraceae bacterium]
MDIDVQGIVVIAGNYGSGKTEIAVNLALHKKKAGLNVSIADLDLVNPYFRAREALDPLEKSGIKVVLPDKKYFNADLPILSPAVASMIKDSYDLAILDAGGDDVGVTVLAALKDSFSGKDVKMIQVVNPYRPFTQDVEGCIKIKEEIEKSSYLKINGIVGNANLIDETTPETIYYGYELLQELSQKTGLKIEFITAATDILPQLDLNKFDCPILPIHRGLVPPWKKSNITKEY